MKLFLDNELILNISETEKKVLLHGIFKEELEHEVKHRATWFIKKRIVENFKILKEEWEPILKSKGVKYIPLDEQEFAELVFAQPEYKARSQREKY